MSYARSDDKHNYRQLTKLCKRLSGEVQVQTGKEFPIFQDRKDTYWGEHWKSRIEESLDAVTFLVPIITPSFFNSSACCAELERFIDREKRLGRNDLILPVYYINCSALNDEEKQDRLTSLIASRNGADWRKLRNEL